MKKPFLYAFGAVLYIVFLVSGMNFVIKTGILPEKTIIIPTLMLGLFVLSAAVMGFLFLYEPLNLYFENKKKEALQFFAKIVGFFAGFVVLFLVLLFISQLVF